MSLKIELAKVCDENGQPYHVEACFDLAGIKRLVAENSRLQKNVNDLNNLLRAVGWGQGEIDSAACIEEENENLRAKNAALRAAVIRTKQAWASGTEEEIAEAINDAHAIALGGAK